MTVQFIPARFDHLVRSIQRARRTHPECLPDSALQSLLRDNNRQYLVSWGQVICKGQQPNMQVMYKMANMLKNCRKPLYCHTVPIVMDSGGYQIQRGLLAEKDIPRFTDLYYDVLPKLAAENMFVLDVAPGGGKDFSDPDRLKSLNAHSYQRAAALPSKIRSRIIYIDHFRTRTLLGIWHQFAEDQYPHRFDLFGTGGIASASIRGALSILPEAIALVRILRHAQAAGRSRFRFHILGTGEPHQLLSYALLNKTIQMRHQIEVQF